METARLSFLPLLENTMVYDFHHKGTKPQRTHKEIKKVLVVFVPLW
jgi:hypothetical protein